MASPPSESETTDYERWRARGAMRHADRALLRQRLERGVAPLPAVELIVDGTAADDLFVRLTLESVQAIDYGPSSLTVISDRPSLISPGTAAQTWVHTTDPFSEGVRKRMAESTCDWIGILRAGDWIESAALLACVDAALRHPEWKLLYTDHERWTVDGTEHPWFVPNFNLDLLRSVDYIGSFVLLARNAFAALGPWGPSGRALAANLAFRAQEHWGDDSVGHVAQLLVRQRGLETASDHAAVVQAHLNRTIHHAQRTASRVIYPAERTPSVTVALSDSSRAAVERWQDSTDYPEVVFCSREALEASTSEYLVFLDADLRIDAKSWLRDLMALGLRTDVVAVGARVLYADGSAGSSALVIGFGGTAGDPQLGGPGHGQPWASLERQVSAVSSAALVVARRDFMAAGGFDPLLSGAEADADLCLRLAKEGRRIVWTPHVTFVRGTPPVPHEGSAPERELFVERWILGGEDDPFFNRNLSLSVPGPALEWQIDVGWDARFDGVPRVLGWPSDAAGSGLVRIFRPLLALEQERLAQVAFMPPLQRERGRRLHVSDVTRLDPDALVLQSTVHEHNLDDLRAIRKHTRTRLVFELDDLKTNLPAANPSAQFLIPDIGRRLEQAIELCDTLVVSTEPLRAHYERAGRDVRVVPNFLARSVWGELTSSRRGGKRPRVGWAGAQQHQGDLQVITPVVEALAREVDWIFFGMCPEDIRPHVAEFHEFVLPTDYPAHLARLDLDLALAPLELHPFNEAKSHLRILEYGIFGWPVVCTDIFPYQTAPVKRVPNTARAWMEAIRERVADPAAAEKEGEILRKWVLENWMLEDNLELVRAAVFDAKSG